MKTDLSIIHIILEASLLVQIVMIILLLASLVSWYIIFRKTSVINQARTAAEQFEEGFWSGGDLIAMYQRLDRKDGGLNGMERIFHSGFREFAKLRKQENLDADAVLEGSDRAMRVALNREVDELELHLPMLATVGSTSPYIGLFGTVWGIMNSFRALGEVQQATLAMVAPGISEALVATAMGLFSAIPAVIAYNHYATHAERLHNRYDAFKEEFFSLLQRQGNS